MFSQNEPYIVFLNNSFSDFCKSFLQKNSGRFSFFTILRHVAQQLEDNITFTLQSSQRTI